VHKASGFWRWVKLVAQGVVFGSALALVWRTGAVPTLFVIGGILASVVAHEAGHLLAARCTGVKATEFFAGFGPTLWSRSSGEITWGLKALPLGGYVRIIGMTRKEQVAPDEEARTFRGAAPWRRAVIGLAGPAVNVALAIALFFGFNLAKEPTPRDAAIASGEILRRTVDASTESIAALPAAVPGMVRAALDDGAADPENRVLSPVGATRLASQAAADGVSTALGLLAIINVFLALFNLVPLPPLDGGHIALATVDSAASRLLRRRIRFDATRLNPVTYAVVGTLLLLGIASIVLDVTRPIANPFG
jgi:membrane-associated protease RseP (regulator of RpoE activity)